MTSTPPKERRGVASWAIRRPIGTVVLTMVALVLGTVFIGDIPLDLLPRIVYPQIRVNVSNPGVEPSVMEETIAKLNGAMMQALADTKVQARFSDLGLDVASRERQTAEGLAAFHKGEIEKWWPIIKSAGIKVE